MSYKFKVFFHFIFLSLALSITYGSEGLAQKINSKADSVFVGAGYVLVTNDTFYISEIDTVFFIKEGIQYSIKKNPYFQSEKFYDSLKSKASKTFLTKSLYSLLVSSSTGSLSENKPIIKAEKAFEPFIGKKYGKIILKNVPILEGSVRDTTKQVRSLYAKSMNKVHIPTNKRIILENLIIKTGEQVDIYQLADNERILRQFRTIRDAKIYLKPTKENPEIVDVIIVTQDVISLGASVDASNYDDFTVSLYDRNILGYARDLQLTYQFDENLNPDLKHGFGVRYRVPNLWGSFIKGDFLYENFNDQRQLGMYLSRDFFTPEIKFGGGIELSHIMKPYNFFLLPPELDLFYLKNLVEVWLGRSLQIEKRTNLIVQGLWQHNDFIRTPFSNPRKYSLFNDNNIYLINFALLKRTYSKTTLIKGFGRTEDLAKGYLFSVTYGIEDSQYYLREYNGFTFDIANYFYNLGYINLRQSIGFYREIDGNTLEDGIIKTNFSYFSPLLKHRKTSFRQFLNISYSKGFNEKSPRYLFVENNFNNGGDVRPYGNEKLNLNTESVLFTPWYFYGCKFSLYNANSLNLLKGDNLPSDENFYSSFSLGLRILNESFVFPTIDINLTLYNNPSEYKNIFDFRVFNNYNNNFQDLRLGKPAIITY